jgi:hypothetical protein
MYAPTPAGVTAVSALSGNLVAAGVSGVLAAFLGFQVQSGAPTLCRSKWRLQCLRLRS